MAENKAKNGCPECAKLAAQVAAMQAQIDALEKKLAKSQKHSGNSSKPPSSDIVKPRRKPGKRGRPKKRRIGGQPGYERHERTPFSIDELDHKWLCCYPAKVNGFQRKGIGSSEKTTCVAGTSDVIQYHHNGIFLSFFIILNW